MSAIENSSFPDGNSVISSIPRWHFAMLNDMERNLKLKQAIQNTDLKNKTVLDIGTGTGFLSMLAVQQGASHVFTCEANPRVAAMARRIIHQNGFEDKITVINKFSTDLIIGMDIPEKADVLISETVDCGFFGEGFGYSLSHAKRNLLRNDATLIPQSASLSCVLLNSEKIARLNHVPDNTLGLSLNLFNEFRTPGYFPVRANTWEHSILSSRVDLMNFSLYEDNCFDHTHHLTFLIRKTALAHGVLFWFRMNLTEDICVSNSPENSDSHWMQAFQLFDRPIPVTVNTQLALSCKTSDSGINFNVPEPLPALKLEVTHSITG